MRHILTHKLFESTSSDISIISPEDNDEIIDILANVFGFIDDRQTIKSKISKRLNNGLSVKIKYNGEIVGCYLLAEKSIYDFINDIEQNKLSDFKKDNTQINLPFKLSNRGLQGISLAILPKYRNLNLGKKLKEYTLSLGYDYVWGVQDKKLNNIDFWKKSRIVFAESPDRYATVKLLN
jgi:Acetyltransferase (GNAT) family